MNQPSPYIVLLPTDRTNPGNKHLVVHISEWVAVSLGEKAGYERMTEHDDYVSAAREREWLNHAPESSVVHLSNLEGATS